MSKAKDKDASATQLEERLTPLEAALADANAKLVEAAEARVKAEARAAEFEASLADSEKARARALEELAEVRDLLEEATRPQRALRGSGARERRVVRVRARNPKLSGLCLYGHNVTAAGFLLDVTEFTNKQLEDLCNDPNVVVEEVRE